jgi:hypothetical protein
MKQEDFIDYNKLKNKVRFSDTPFVVNKSVIGLPYNLSDLISYLGKEIIPNTLGIYHLFYNEQLIYIGMSKNLRGRLLHHLKNNDMPFNNCLWFCAKNWKKNATIKDILEIEYKMIKTFKPVLNTIHFNSN